MPESITKAASVAEAEHAEGKSGNIQGLSKEEYDKLEKKLVRTLDIRLLPMIVLVSFRGKDRQQKEG